MTYDAILNDNNDGNISTNLTFFFVIISNVFKRVCLKCMQFVIFEYSFRYFFFFYKMSNI